MSLYTWLIHPRYVEWAKGDSGVENLLHIVKWPDKPIYFAKKESKRLAEEGTASRWDLLFSHCQSPVTHERWCAPGGRIPIYISFSPVLFVIALAGVLLSLLMSGCQIVQDAPLFFPLTLECRHSVAFWKLTPGLRRRAPNPPVARERNGALGWFRVSACRRDLTFGVSCETWTCY